MARVLVDDNNRVKKGDVLLQLDPEPYQVQVTIKQAAVDAAQANLVVARANVQGLLGQELDMYGGKHIFEGRISRIFVNSRPRLFPISTRS